MPGGQPPAGDVAPPPRTGLAWERRDELGPGPAILQTIREVVFSPSAAFAAMRRGGGWAEPLGFAVLVGSVFAWVGQGWNLLTRSVMVGALEGTPGLDTQAIAAANVQEVWVALLTPLFLLAWTFIVAAVFHGMLVLFGGAPYGFETSFRVVCYSWAASVFQLLPICGALIGWVWGIVVVIIGLREAQEVPGGRAAAAVLVPAISCCLCAGIVGLLTFGALLSLAQMGV